MKLTITEAMVEAGAIAYVKVKAQPPEAICAAIYAAMEERRDLEETRRKNPAAEKPVYVHQDWPKWIDHPDGGGKGKVFAKAEDVPADWAKPVKAKKAA